MTSRSPPMRLRLTRDHMTEALLLAKREALPLVVLGVCAAAMATFLHVAHETVIEGETRDFDLHVLPALREPGQPHLPVGPAWMLEALRDLSALVAHTLPQKRQQTYVLVVAVTVTVIVGFSRIYLGVHWTTDVLAGWSVGAAWASYCWLIAFVWERLTDHRLSEPGDAHTSANTPPTKTA